MSNALAIQAVTDCLRRVILRGVALQHEQGLPELTGLVFTYDPPALIVPQADKLHVNLFLYRLANNSVWANQPIPPGAKPGERAQPPLALNLHYLVTIITATHPLPEQHILGRVMAAMFEHPVLAAKDYQITNNPHDLSLNSLESIRASGLSDQTDRIRFTPVYLTLEDLARINSGAEAKLRLSMAYEASPVLIESTKSIKAGLPVLFRGRGVLHGQPDGFSVVPFHDSPSLANARFPFVDQPTGRLLRIIDRGRINDTLVIEGTGLSGQGLKLKIRNIASSKIHTFTLNDDQIQRGSVRFPFVADGDWIWVAGLYTVSAIIDLGEFLGTITTNEVAFTLVPDATTLTVNPLKPATPKGSLDIKVNPKVVHGQVVSLLIGSVEIAIGPLEADFATFEIVFVVDPNTKVTSDSGVKRVAYDARAIPKGDYPVRIRVDGADNLLFDPEATTLNGYQAKYKVHLENGEVSKISSQVGAPVTP